ncbi:uncharacterized protein EI97DRAFT_199666 [Westerdykella ornata]|uniref:Myb-like domain-containing protein n=1 Tax=Westerdykella ornata TaxID=318751 RepID=A0A6A6JC21_WESOR|nr:uncharacterized protein EI97DRAFT_199666 [Westerdykella ornata]KAF2272739.1 hypothetical protein EI97DRAFT_199666 [Westerdykella ornata]
MSSSRYPDNTSRYPRERSPYRDRRASTYTGSTYAPRGGDSHRPSADSVSFSPRDVPRGPKSLADPARPSPSGPPAVPSGPRDPPRRAFSGRGDGPPSLRDAPPLTTLTSRDHNTRDHWRADRDRDRDFRERRPSPPPRRSPVRDSRDYSLNIDRARRNSRDGPLSAGSTYSDPPLTTGSSYRGSGIGGRGRGGRDFGGDFRPRGRGYIDERDRHHDPRDRVYRPRSRSRDPIRRERDARDERDFDRRDRDDRRFDRRDDEPRRYDSYQGSAALKPALRSLDTHRTSAGTDLRNPPGTATGPNTPHSAHHSSTNERAGSFVDAYSRRSSVVAEAPSAKDARRQADQNDLIASRAELSKERYGPRASSPPASVPNFGFVSNVWRNPALDSKPASGAPAPKAVAAPPVSSASGSGSSGNASAPSLVPPPVPASTSTRAFASVSTPVSAPVSAPASTPVSAPPSAPVSVPASTPVSAPLPAPVSAPASAAASAPVSAPVSAPNPAPASATVSKPAIPSGLSTVPPTGPKADRVDRPQTDDHHVKEGKPHIIEAQRTDAGGRSVMPPSTAPTNLSAPELADVRVLAPTAGPANILPTGPGARHKIPPGGPPAGPRMNVAPAFSRPPPPSHTVAESSSGTIPLGPRKSLPMSASPKSTPMNIPTGPKADRAPLVPRPPLYAPPDRPGFGGPRNPWGKSNQWVRPDLNRPPIVPAKREFPTEDRERAFGSAPKAPRLEASFAASDAQRSEQTRVDGIAAHRASEASLSKIQVPPQPVKAPSPQRSPAKARRSSDTSMPDASPRMEQAASAPVVPEGLPMDDSDDDFLLDEEDFATSEAKYKREKALLESRLVDLSASRLRATTPLQEIMLLSSLSLEHLPGEPSVSKAEDGIAMNEVPTPAANEPSADEGEPMAVDEETAPAEETAPTPAPIQLLETVTAELPISKAELPTPKAEESGDHDVEGKGQTRMAPATRTLRLRKDRSADRETTPPDFSSLPYLASAPPTPPSELDPDRPSIPESVLVGIRDMLRKATAPERSPEEVLQEYAETYRNWRAHVQELDQQKGQDDHDIQPSAEGSLKATTPDAAGSTTAALLDGQPTHGRRGHGGRFATELDLEQAIKESLKTAEEERMGKRDKETQKSSWDPEREAVVPTMLTAYDIQRRCFIDTNFQREPGQGIFVYHYEPPEDDFTEEEHKVMVQHYKDQYAKKWGKLAEILHKELGTSRTYKDTINHYYATKWGREFKQKYKRGRAGGTRKKTAVRGRGAQVDRTEQGDDTPLALTDTGRPRRQAAPTFGNDTEVDSLGATPTPARQRRQNELDGPQEKAPKRGKAREKGGRKQKAQQPVAVAPAPSPGKVDKKERDVGLGVKAEDEPGKQPAELPLLTPSLQPTPLEDQLIPHNELATQAGLPPTITERPRSNTTSRPGPSSYWSVTEQNDFHRNVAHFGTDFAAIAEHMKTKSQTMVKNQYLRLVESGSSPDLEKLANEADRRRERGEHLGPPPTPTPAPKRRYDNPAVLPPRSLAPTPEVAESIKSPPIHPLAHPTFSPSHHAPLRFPSTATTPMQAASIAPGAGSMVETPLAALPSGPPRHSPPAPPPPPAPQQRIQVQHLQPAHSHRKSHHIGPRAGYFSDDQPLRIENRAPPQQPPLTHPPHPLQQQLQAQMPPQIRSQEPNAATIYRSHQHEREAQIRLEQQHEREAQLRFETHSRRLSMDTAFARQPSSSVAVSGPSMSMMRASSGPGSPERRPSQHRYMPAYPPTTSQPQQQMISQPPGSMAAPQQLPSRSTLVTPTVKEEPRHYSISAQASNPHHTQRIQHAHSQAQVQAHLPTYPQPPPTSAQTSAPAPAPAAPPRPPTEPKKSSLLSLLNADEPEEPRRKKATEVPSQPPTPQQHQPVAPPPPTQTTQRSEFYGAATSQPAYLRASYSQPHPLVHQQHPAHLSASRQIIDQTNEQQGARASPRDGWQQRQTFHPAQGSAQQSAPVNSPHSSLAQPGFGENRIHGTHRSLLAQHSGPRYNTPPPNAYSGSPHMHSRASSISGPPHQSRHVPSDGQATPGSSQILQPNPYAQVEPTGGSLQNSGPAGMRATLHYPNAGQQRDTHDRKEQSQMPTANLPFSKPQTPGDIQPPHAQIRAGSIVEPYRPRDTFREYNPQTHDRDSSRELSQRTDMLLREQMARSTGQHPPHQETQWPPGAHGYPRSHTPLSRSEHPQQTSMRPPMGQATPLADSVGLQAYGQRLPEEPRHQYLDAYPTRDERFAREEQAYHQQARLRNEELRDGGARYRDEMMRREGGMSGAPPPPPPPTVPQQPQHEHRGSHGGPMDWASAVPRGHERWQPHQR